MCLTLEKDELPPVWLRASPSLTVRSKDVGQVSTQEGDPKQKIWVREGRRKDGDFLLRVVYRTGPDGLRKIGDTLRNRSRVLKTVKVAKTT